MSKTSVRSSMNNSPSCFRESYGMSSNSWIKEQKVCNDIKINTIGSQEMLGLNTTMSPNSGEGMTGN